MKKLDKKMKNNDKDPMIQKIKLKEIKNEWKIKNECCFYKNRRKMKAECVQIKI